MYGRAASALAKDDASGVVELERLTLILRRDEPPISVRIRYFQSADVYETCRPCEDVHLIKIHPTRVEVRCRLKSGLPN